MPKAEAAAVPDGTTEIKLGVAENLGLVLVPASERAAQQYGADVRDILMECGKRRLVGGQEDMIYDVALTQVAGRRSSPA